MAFSFSAAESAGLPARNGSPHSALPHTQHHRAGACVARKKRNCRQSRKQDHQRVADISERDEPCLLPLLCDLIWTRRACPLLGLSLRQTLERRSQVPEQLLRRPSGRHRGLRAKHEYSGSSSSLGSGARSGWRTRRNLRICRSSGDQSSCRIIRISVCHPFPESLTGTFKPWNYPTDFRCCRN